MFNNIININYFNNFISNFIAYWFLLNNYNKIKIILYNYNREMAEEIIENMRKYKYISPDYEKFLLDFLSTEQIDQNLISAETINKFYVYYLAPIYDIQYISREINIFFRGLVEFLTKYNLPISSPIHLFTLFTYIHDTNFIPIAEKINLDCSANSKLQINYLFILIIYLLIEKIYTSEEKITNILDLDEDELKDKIYSICMIIKTLIGKKIILNPIISTQEFIDSNELTFVSIFDILAYSVYTKHDCKITIFFLNLMMDLVGNSELNLKNITINKVNPDTLIFLFKYIDNNCLEPEQILFSEDRYEIITEYYKNYDSDDKYKYSFGQILNLIYINSGTEYYFNKSISQIILSIYLDEKFNTHPIINLCNNTSITDVIRLFGDLEKICDIDIYEKAISLIINSPDITDYKKIFYIIIMFRYEISFDDIIQYDGDLHEYSFEESEVKQIITKEYYYDKCRLKLSDFSFNTVMELAKIMEKYINLIHPELLALEKIDLNNYEECVICLADIKKIKKVCIGCKKCFHRKCILSWTKKNKTTCPICRRDVSSVIDFNPDEKINLLKYLIKCIKG